MDQEKQRAKRVFDQLSHWWNAVEKYNRPGYEAVASRLDYRRQRVLDVGCRTGILANWSPGMVKAPCPLLSVTRRRCRKVMVSLIQ